MLERESGRNLMVKSQFIEDGLVHKNEWVNHDTLEMVVISPQIAEVAQVGQFIMVSCAKAGSSPLLRRPISIHDINDDTFSLLYKVVGTGTEILSEVSVGDKVSMLGPLGKGFKVANTKHHCLVGGGIGLAPLLHLAKEIKIKQPESRISILQGAQSSKDLLIEDKFNLYGEMQVSTDDGSRGHHGFVTELLDQLSVKETTVYTCGPELMMKAVAGISKKHNWNCQVSMETHMACGMGACLGCSYPRAGDHQGVEKYVHVCKDGPVFDAQVIWE